MMQRLRSCSSPSGLYTLNGIHESCKDGTHYRKFGAWSVDLFHVVRGPLSMCLPSWSCAPVRYDWSQSCTYEVVMMSNH